MCNLDDYLRYANVVSKTYQAPQSKSELIFKDFLSLVGNLDAGIASLPFFTTELLEDEQVRMKVYCALRKPPSDLPKGLHFDSYLHVQDMASLVLHDEYESEMAPAFERLQEFLEGRGLRATTPVFTIMSGDETLKYVILKVGYTADPSREQSTETRLDQE